MKTTKERLEQLDAVYSECREIFRRKNEDYKDSFSLAGAVGVLVRLGDKLDRCKNITKTSITLVNDEKIRDTLLDIANYAKMTIFLMDEKEGNKVDEPKSFSDIDLWQTKKMNGETK